MYTCIPVVLSMNPVCEILSLSLCMYIYIYIHTYIHTIHTYIQYIQYMYTCIPVVLSMNPVCEILVVAAKVHEVDLQKCVYMYVFIRVCERRHDTRPSVAELYLQSVKQLQALCVSPCRYARATFIKLKLLKRRKRFLKELLYIYTHMYVFIRVCERQHDTRPSVAELYTSVHLDTYIHVHRGWSCHLRAFAIRLTLICIPLSYAYLYTCTLTSFVCLCYSFGPHIHTCTHVPWGWFNWMHVLFLYLLQKYIYMHIYMHKCTSRVVLSFCCMCCAWTSYSLGWLLEVDTVLLSDVYLLKKVLM